MPTMTVNTSDLELIRARQENLMGLLGLDSKRPTAWLQYGYPQAVSFDELYRAYQRSGAAKGAVHRTLDKCWEKRPRIKQPGADKETPWETKLARLLSSINAWQKLRDFDRRNMVGRYAGLIYRVADSVGSLREPLVRGQKLVDLVPVYESQLRVTEWDSDRNSPTFGQPRMWQYRVRDPKSPNEQAKPDDWADVHPSRVQILAEGSVGDDFQDGVPLLLAGFNNLIDLEKVAGGSGESFLKNSARAVTINFEANASPQVITQNADGTPSGKTVRQVLGEQVDNLNRSIDSALVTQGATASTLQTTVADPMPSFEVAANLFAASVQIPFTILFGQQTGRLASDEDKADWNARCQSRRENELTPMLEQLVRRLQAAGLVDAGEFEIEWQPLDAPTEEARAKVLAVMTGAMKQHFEAGGAEPLFDRDELRKVMGYEQKAPADDFREGDPTAPPPAPMPQPAPGPRAALRAAA